MNDVIDRIILILQFIQQLIIQFQISSVNTWWFRDSFLTPKASRNKLIHQHPQVSLGH